MSSWLPSPAADSGFGQYLRHNPGQGVSSDWDANPFVDGFLADLIAQDIVAPLNCP